MTEVDNNVPADLMEGAVDVSHDQDGGVMKVILREGTTDESPGVGNEVIVHYVGTLANGDKFDSSRDREDKFKFKLGQGQVIKAWDQGVASMKRGELCRLICKSDYAYGENGSPPKIPGGATLIFEVELFDWCGEDLSEDKDGGITRSVIKSGTGWSSPNDDAQVEVDVKGTFEGRVFDERSVSFSVGDAADAELPESLDVAIKKFKKEESSVLKLASKYGFKDSPPERFGLPNNAAITYQVTLKSFEKAKESYELEAGDKIEQSELCKTKAASLMKDSAYTRAEKKYKRILNLLSSDEDFNEEFKDKRQALMLAVHLNLALCYIKQEEWLQARESCNNALNLDEKNVKGLFRRAQSYMGTKDYKEAADGFRSVLVIEPSNKAAKNQQTRAEQEQKKYLDREKKLYSNMFSKLSTPNKTAGDS